MEKTICELFAGVGGFRLGFDKLESGWETVWFSQWEPSTSNQFAHKCYVSHFGDSKDLAGEYTTNQDIASVNKENIPDFNLLVGGFPCQDYSVARSLSGEKGIEGKKGVLWWSIVDVIKTKKPKFCIFENVDRLLKSPSKQRGRDFGMILACLEHYGYNAEWRVVNAAEYGASQKRRRVFIFAYQKDTDFAKTQSNSSLKDIMLKDGFHAQAFPISEISNDKEIDINIYKDMLEVSNNFAFAFENGGVMRDGIIHTAKVTVIKETAITLGEILEKNVDKKFYISETKLEKWKYLKGSKKIERTAKNGHTYFYSEGPVAFPDHLDQPGRTMLTSEQTVNRSSHIILDPETKNYRTITPVEAERLQGFDDNWTNSGMSDRQRFFCMGNALVVPMITRMGKVLDKIIIKEK